MLFAVALIGMGHAHWAAMSKLESPLGALLTESPVKVQGAIVAPVRQTPDGLILLVEARRIFASEPQAIHGRIRLTWREPDAALVYGDEVSVTTRLREPYGTLNPGGFEYGAYLQRKGIQAVATVSGPDGVTRLTQEPVTLWGRLMGRVDHWRQAIHHAASTSLSPPATGLFLGMIIGEQSFIEQDVRDAFMASGTVHILSISGSHLGLLALVVFAGTRWSVRRLPASWLERVSIYMTATQLAVVITLPIVTLYMLLAGAEMATVRSWIMIVVCSLGSMVGTGTPSDHRFSCGSAFDGLALIPKPSTISLFNYRICRLSPLAWCWYSRKTKILAQEVLRMRNYVEHQVGGRTCGKRTAGLAGHIGRQSDDITVGGLLFPSNSLARPVDEYGYCPHGGHPRDSAWATVGDHGGDQRGRDAPFCHGQSMAV